MGFADAMVGTTNAVNAMNGRGRIERLCQQLGWNVDDKKGERITLNFNCPVIGRRPVFILHGDHELVLFAAYSTAIFDSSNVPDVATSFALFQSSQSEVGKWEVSFGDENNELFFRLVYNALGAGLNAAALKFICSGMGKIASDFDARMKREGYLQ